MRCEPRLHLYQASTPDCSLKLLKGFSWSLQHTHPLLACGMKLECHLFSQDKLWGYTPKHLVQYLEMWWTALLSYAIQGLSGHTQVYSNLSFPASFLHLRLCVRDPQSHPEAQKLLEGLTRLRKVVIFMFVVYYSRRTQIKISKGERYTGQSPGKTRHKPGVPSQRSLMGAHSALPATVCDNTCCPSESSLGISIQCFC